MASNIPATPGIYTAVERSTRELVAIAKEQESDNHEDPDASAQTLFATQRDSDRAFSLSLSRTRIFCPEHRPARGEPPSPSSPSDRPHSASRLGSTRHRSFWRRILPLPSAAFDIASLLHLYLLLLLLPLLHHYSSNPPFPYLVPAPCRPRTAWFLARATELATSRAAENVFQNPEGATQIQTLVA